MPNPNVRSLHHNFMDGHAHLRSSGSFGPQQSFCFVSVSQDGKCSVPRKTGSESFSPGMIVDQHIQGDLHIVICLRIVGFVCFGPVLYLFDACPSQAKDVCPQRAKIILGCAGTESCSGSSCSPGLVLLPSSMQKSCQARSLLISADSPFLVFVFRTSSNLMQCLSSWCFRRFTTDSSASSSTGMRSLYLSKNRVS